jgi:anaerobic magnesium-protoporphyrin IX monomethyl ester cyclase
MKKLRFLLVSPAAVFDPKDPFTTGVVFMPIGLAYGAAALEKVGVEVDVLDLFGESPQTPILMNKYIRLGASNELLFQRVLDLNPNLVLFYANQLLNHESLIESIAAIRRSFPDLLIGVAENTQAVTAYLLSEVSKDFFDSGANFIISGEMEEVLEQISKNISNNLDLESWNLDGVSTAKNSKNRAAKLVNLDELEIPAWHLFPLQNYWKIGYAHGPFESESYLPLLTSRGCPFPCKFCVVPATNNRKWRFRSAINVVNEIEELTNKFGVKEFHLEDLNPTIQDSRMQDIAKELIKRDLKVNWKIVAGTKIESIKSIDTLQLMRESGLSYLSMSPESGSKKVLKEIGKPFDVSHALEMTRKCYELKIRTQACFVLGYPTERTLDRLQSLILATRLTISGVDEIVVFIMSPVPGSEVYKSYLGQFDSLASLSFSPRWRLDFYTLLAWRVTFYLLFMSLKFVRNPIRMIAQLQNLWTGRFQTKMEMTPVRGLKYRLLSKKVRSHK